MIVQRDEFYFEPRCIGCDGRIRWYGEVYTGQELLQHIFETVYIRDNGKELFVYTLESDKRQQEHKIEAVFTLVCRMKKNSGSGRYGKKKR